MHNSLNTNIQEDEIDLRELFSTIYRYKWSIILLTLFITFSVAVKVYFMPKYYKSTITIELKSNETKSGGFSLGGAAAMLLGGGTVPTVDLEKDVTLLNTYRTNEKVLDEVNSYMIRYFITNEKHKEEEIEENISIELTDVRVKDFKNYGMRLSVEPLNSTTYKLSSVGFFYNTPIGNYHYSEIVDHEDFTLMIHKKKDFKQVYTIELSGTKRYVYENIILENLSIEADKTSPFITLSLLDTIPKRAEQYLKKLIKTYTQQSIEDTKGDAQIIIDSYEKQLKKVELQVDSTAKDLENYKITNQIINPQLQASALVEELSKINIEIAQNSYKYELLSSLIQFTKSNSNIDAIAPSLIELQDEPTMSLIKLLQEQQLQLSDLLIKYKPDHPTILRINQTIYNLKQKVLSNLKNLQKTLNSKTKSLKKMESGYKKKLQSSPKKEQELITFSRDYQVNEKMYLYLLQKQSSAKLKHDKALDKFKVIEGIYTSDYSVKPKKALIVIVTFIISLILMIFIAFFREFLKAGKNINA